MTNDFIKQMDHQWQGSVRLLAAGLLSSWLGVVGLPATPIAHLPLLTTPAAMAQTSVSNEEITQYARSVLEMDRYRNEAYTEIKDLLLTVNMDISEVNVSCSDTQDISQVPRSVRRQVREILVNYCNQAQEIVESNGLSSRRFNEITAAHEADEALFERIQQELIRLQQAQ